MIIDQIDQIIIKGKRDDLERASCSGLKLIAQIDKAGH